jgi:hypothetical protein
MNEWQEILKDFNVMIGGLGASKQTGRPRGGRALFIRPASAGRRRAR